MERRNRTDKHLRRPQSKSAVNVVRGRLLETNPIIDIWRLAHVANYYVFPMFREFDRCFGLTRAQFVSLLSLHSGGAETAQEIVVGSGLPKNSINRAVRLLESKKLINRRKSQTDGRSIHLSVTKDGKKLLNRCVEYAQRRQDQVFADLTKTEKAQFDKLIVKLCRSVPNWAEMERIDIGKKSD